MTEATAGSVAEGSAGTPAAPPAAVVNGSPTPAADPFSGLSEGTRSWVSTKGYKSPEDVAKAAQNLEQKIGSMFTAPAADAPPEELSKFYSRLGWPDKADKYEFKRPEKLPADVPYSDDLAKASKDWMHKAYLNPKQAQMVHDEFVGYVAQQQQAAQKRLAEAVTTTHDTLVKEWGGPPESEAFKTKLALADRAMKNLGLTEAYKQAGILLPDGSLTNPQIAKAFAEIGQAMFREDTINGDGRPPSGENPFKRDASGSIKSPDAISALIKSDPERAKRLCQEAGEPIERWFTNNPR